MCNNPKLDHVNMNAYIKFGEILSIRPQDIERKSRAITMVQMCENDVQESQARSCQFQCIYKIW